jgi:hypothetical protein
MGGTLFVQEVQQVSVVVIPEDALDQIPSRNGHKRVNFMRIFISKSLEIIALPLGSFSTKT